MNRYKVEITETLQRVVKVRAPTLDEAVAQVRERYKREEIILDSGDFVDVHIAEFVCHVT
jgi:translation initiation factor IF-1